MLLQILGWEGVGRGGKGWEGVWVVCEIVGASSRSFQVTVLKFPGVHVSRWAISTPSSEYIWTCAAVKRSDEPTYLTML